jgi:hypothetical protein
MPGPPPPSQKDAGQVLRYAFDDEDGALRVDATISSGGSDLEIHYEDDSIAIGDPASDNILAINKDGSIKQVQLFNIPFDAITATYPTDTQEVYQSRIGGITGTVQQTLTVNYTDMTKALLLNVFRTTP